MKGKYASAAEKRREHEGLQQRLVIAERERDRLAGELADDQERHEKEVTSLRETIASLRTQRDQAVSPDLEEAFKTVHALKQETEALRKEKVQVTKTNIRIIRTIRAAARAAGFRDKDAGLAQMALLDPDDHATFDSTPRQKAAYRRPGAHEVDVRNSRPKGYRDDGLTDSLFRFYNALASDGWRREGPALVVDNWFAPEEARERED